MKKALVLIAQQDDRSGFTPLRIYPKLHEEQALMDRDITIRANPLGACVVLYECEFYEPIEKIED